MRGPDPRLGVLIERGSKVLELLEKLTSGSRDWLEVALWEVDMVWPHQTKLGVFKP